MQWIPHGWPACWRSVIGIILGAIAGTMWFPLNMVFAAAALHVVWDLK